MASKKLSESELSILNDFQSRNNDIVVQVGAANLRIDALKRQLNEELVKAMQSGEDVNIYREKIDSLETDLRDLYQLNGKLASIVLPVKQMYKEMVDELHKKGISITGKSDRLVRDIYMCIVNDNIEIKKE